MAFPRFAYVHESSRWLPESLTELDIFILPCVWPSVLAMLAQECAPIYTGDRIRLMSVCSNITKESSGFPVLDNNHKPQPN
jgi:hypothetical protein